MSRKRILHCLVHIGSGGVEQRRLALARQLDPARYEQVVMCTTALGGLPADFQECNCRIIEVGAFRGILDYRPYLSALHFVREYRPHIIHGAVYEGVALAAVVGRLARVPVIIGEETSDPTNRRWTGHSLYRVFCAMSNHMVAVSPAVRNYLVKKIRVSQEKVTLISNGVIEKPKASSVRVSTLRGCLDIPSSDFVIGTVGRLFDDVKRVSDLIRALALIRRTMTGARLLIVGDGPDEETLRRLASELGVGDYVTFAGYQPDPQPYYALMDVFVLASAREAFGLVLVEAMFAGLPVVATDVGGIPYIVEKGATGLLVRPGNPTALAEALKFLESRPGLREQLGAKGKERARLLFSAERYVRDVDALYQRLLGRHSMRSGLFRK